ARRFLEAGAQTVKIEGNKPAVIKALMGAGIPVMGHVGLLPQTAESHKVKGKEKEEAERIYRDAVDLDLLGVFSIVLESIPKRLARRITEAVESPTIGIGAGIQCDGQVLVINDLLGMDESWKPKFVKRYAHLESIIKEAVRQFIEDVLKGKFPDEKHTYH
ncbi:MAG: 3-methyl-2-oxobutanoate hydroxymethyltransferase, partial [Candidatus Bathyarchaeia archaeon]